MNPQLIKKILETQEGQALISYIEQKIQKLDTVMDIKSMQAEEIALEVKAREHAVTTLKEMFKELVFIAESSAQSNEPNPYMVDVE